MNIEGKKGCLGVYLRQVRTSNISYQNTAHLKQCIVENSGTFNTRDSKVCRGIDEGVYVILYVEYIHMYLCL